MRFAHFFEESYHKKFPPRGKLSLPALEEVNNYDDDDDKEEEVDNNDDHKEKGEEEEEE